MVVVELVIRRALSVHCCLNRYKRLEMKVKLVCTLYIYLCVITGT